MRPVLRPGLRLHRAATPDDRRDNSRDGTGGSTRDGIHDTGRGRAALVDVDRVYWIDEVTAALLESLDGLLDEETLLHRHPGPDAAAAWQRLRGNSVVVDVEAPARLLRALDEDVRADALAETTALVARDPGTASSRWQLRRAGTVALAGHGVVTTALHSLLRRSGVGRVLVAAARDRTGRAGRTGRTGGTGRADQPDHLERADVVVLTHDHEPPTDDAERLMRAGVPHLVTGMRGTRGVVGPFVRPGTTGCLRCMDLTRAAADPGWARLRDQLSQPGAANHPLPTPAAGAVTAVLAGLAAADVLLQLEGATPATLDATLSLSADQPLPTRRSWTTHHACGCSWHAEIGSRGEWTA